MSLPDWLQRLRQSQIIDPVKSGPGTQGDYFLGIHRDEVCRQVIGCGQADFDEPYRHLDGRDRALLYAYFNQRAHLEELLEAFRQLFKKGPLRYPLIVVDLGCGPFTGGLALAAALGNAARFSYIGVDRSSAMRELGKRLAAAAEHTGALNCPKREWVEDFDEIPHQGAPSWRPILVIASYLLASPTLDPKVLAEKVDALCKRLGSGPVKVLYTNATSAGANESFEVFRTALESLGFALVTDDQGSITIDRLSGPRERKLRYALFCRKSQDLEF